MTGLAREEASALVGKFETEGLISEREVALCFMLKKKKREELNKSFNGFVLYYDETPQLYENVKTMAEKGKSFEFQFAYKEYGDADIADGHWTSGMVRFDAESNNLKILLCDPLGEGSSEVFRKMFAFFGFDCNKLAEKHKVEVYLSSDKLQSTKLGCSYFAIDNCFMLSTQSNYEDVFSYMKDNAQSKVESGDLTTFSSTLPVRLKRQQQSLETLRNVLSVDEQASKIVNKKEETMKEAIEKNKSESLVRDKKTGEFVPKMRNIRMAKKREGLKKDIEKAIDNEIASLGDGEKLMLLENAIEAHRLPGLTAFTANILSSPKQQEQVSVLSKASSNLKFFTPPQVEIRQESGLKKKKPKPNNPRSKL
jgi:hypothetical protein